VSKAGSNEQFDFDTDMLQCKVDILRAHNIIPSTPPPHNETPQKNPATQNPIRDALRHSNTETTQSSDAAEISTHKDTSSIPIAPPRVETQPASSATGKETAPLPTKGINHTDTAKTPELEQGPSGRENTPKVQADQIKPNKDTAAKSGNNEQEKPEIPSFDLAEDIMAEQRKITAIRRKAPGKKIEAQQSEHQAQPADNTIEQPTQAMSEREKIIAEIVARDIERLYGGDYSANNE
jgi:hypothetical protein